MRSGDSWYFRLVSSLQRSLWNENHFGNLLCENQLYQVHCLEWNKVSCHLSSKPNMKKIAIIITTESLLIYDRGPFIRSSTDAAWRCDSISSATEVLQKIWWGRERGNVLECCPHRCRHQGQELTKIDFIFADFFKFSTFSNLVPDWGQSRKMFLTPLLACRYW